MKGNERNFLKKVKQYRNEKRSIHQKKRKLYSITLKLEKLESDFKEEKVRICFGSKVLFHKQFHLEENAFNVSRVEKKMAKKQELLNLPLSALKMKPSETNPARMI